MPAQLGSKILGGITSKTRPCTAPQVLIHEPPGQTTAPDETHKKAFSVGGPNVWNALSLKSREAESLSTFKANLKKELFKKAVACLLSVNVNAVLKETMCDCM